VTRARLARLLRPLGAPGVVALGVLFFCAAFWVSALGPLAERHRNAGEHVARLEAARASGHLSAGDGLEAFYRLFRDGKGGSDWLQVIYRLARAENLQLRQGTYRYDHVQDARLARYEIALPVTGTYIQVRRFVATVLNEVPIASLDGIGFERKRVDDPHVEAQVKFTLFLDPSAEGRAVR